MIKPIFSIIYAHRNRDAERIKSSFISLKNQKLQNFEIIFVDYGSEVGLVKELEKIAGDFDFVRFYHLPVSQLLWNKSKALNFGIIKAKGDKVFISDIDLVFHPETSTLWEKLQDPKKFYLFSLGYLDKRESQKLSKKTDFNKSIPQRYGNVNGMILTTKESLLQINGFDEFFHFYGAEDEDLFSRLENAGYKREQREEKYFYHIWHQSFSGSEDKMLTGNPRIKNIMRINQRHYYRNRDLGLIKPLRQVAMGTFVSEERSARLRSPILNYRIPNIYSYVEHFLKEELPALRGKVIQVVFFEDDYHSSIKYRFKKSFGIQTQPNISMKNLNDLVLKEIIYNYRNHNYSFKIGKDLKSIEFRLEI